MATTGVTKWKSEQTFIRSSPFSLKKESPKYGGSVDVTFTQFKTYGFAQNLVSDVFVGFRISVQDRRKPTVHFVPSFTEAGRFVEGLRYLVAWPYDFRFEKKKLFCYFPDSSSLRFVLDPVQPDLPIGTVKVQPNNGTTYSPRELLQHMKDLRTASLRRTKKRNRKESGLYPPFPLRVLIANPTIVKESFVHGMEDYLTAYHQVVEKPQVFYKLWSSVRTPGYRSLKKRQLPVNNYSCTLIKSNNGRCHDLRTDPFGYVNDWGQTTDHFSVAAAPVHNELLYNKSLFKCIERAGLSLDGNLAQDVAQLSQTINVIADVTRRLASALHHVNYFRPEAALSVLLHGTTGTLNDKKRSSLGVSRTGVFLGNGKYFRKDKEPSLRGSVADLWLSLQYGWKPLLQDIHASLDSLARYYALTPNIIRTVRGRSVSDVYENVPIGLQSARYQRIGLQQIATRSECKVGFRYTIASKLTQFLAQTGFTNPVNLAWEVLPYSFVLDWLLPVGPWLTTLSAYDGLSFVDGFVTRFTRQEISAMIDYKGSFPGTYQPSTWDIAGRFGRVYIIVNRTKLTTFPSADCPQFKNPFSVTHALNGLALLEAAFGPSGKRSK